MKMKVYNVKDSKRFFERLARCRGEVEAVNESGLHLTLTKGNESADTLPMTYMKGEIKEMELVFANTKDSYEIFSYLMGM